MEAGEIAPSVRQPVAESWARSKEAGVDPNMAAFPRVPEEELQQRQEARKDLLGRMAEVVKSLEEILGSAGVMIALFDDTACMLSCAGDKAVIGFAAGAGLSPGAVLREDAVGTNGVAMAIVTGQPSCCWSPEHYCLRLHHLNDAAAPVYGPGPRLIGSLALFAMASSSQAQHLLALAMSAAAGARIHHRTKRQSEWLKRHRQPLADLFGASSEAMAVVSPRGYVKQITPAALKLLNISSAKDLDKAIDKIAQFSQPIGEWLSEGKEFREERVEIKTSAANFACSVDGSVLRDPLGQVLGTLIRFRGRQPLTGAAARPKASAAKFSFNDIVGESEAIVRAKETALQVAATSVSVLLEGGSGTGKEMFAQAIHNASDRREEPFVAVNCAAIPSELVESELFGYSRGAFTGARWEGMTGKFEAADKGSIFLDEICETPLAMQSEILRALENRAIVRVGEHREVPVDIRIIAATNRKLIEEVDRGNLREDLYYRLSVTKLSLPTLPERASDIPMLVESFIEQFNQVMGRDVKGISDRVLEMLMNYHWPGNVRELRNAIEHAVMVAGGETIEWDHLPDELAQNLLYRGAAHVDRRDPLLDQKKGLAKITRDLQNGSKELYMKALDLANGNRTRAAEILGVGRSTFYRKIAEIEAGDGNDSPDALKEQRRDVEDSTRDLYVEALRMSGGNVRKAADLVGVGRSTFYRKLARLRIPKRELEQMRGQRAGD